MRRGKHGGTNNRKGNHRHGEPKKWPASIRKHLRGKAKFKAKRDELSTAPPYDKMTKKQRQMLRP